MVEGYRSKPLYIDRKNTKTRHRNGAHHEERRKTKVTENFIQNEIRIALSQYGIVVRQNTGNFTTNDGRHVNSGVPGLSDLLFIGCGFCAFIEVKKPGGRASKEQLAFIRRMRELGQRAGIAYSVADALAIIGESL